MACTKYLWGPTEIICQGSHFYCILKAFQKIRQFEIHSSKPVVSSQSTGNKLLQPWDPCTQTPISIQSIGFPPEFSFWNLTCLGPMSGISDNMAKTNISTTMNRLISPSIKKKNPIHLSDHSKIHLFRSFTFNFLPVTGHLVVASTSQPWLPWFFRKKKTAGLILSRSHPGCVLGILMAYDIIHI